METTSNPLSVNQPASHKSTALEDHERLAYAEGHDVDLPANDGTLKEALAHTLPSEREGEQDLEKNGFETHSSVISTTEQGHKDANIVDWDGPDDPANPMNWKSGKKIKTIALISATTFATPLGSTIFAPGVPDIMREFHSTNTEIAAFMVSVYILGFCCGPMIVAPMSELYGRVYVTHISNVLFLIFTVACAVSTDIPMFIVFRFFMGAAGSTPLTVGGGIIADLYPPEKRGGAMAIWALGPLMSPVIGPIIGGYIAESIGWRWSFWVLAIVIGVLIVACLLVLRETYAVTILGRRTVRLRKETGNQALLSRLDLRLTPRQLFIRSIVRPIKLLFLQPIVFMMSLDVAIVYGYLYLLFTTFTFVFEDQYGFSSGQAGLVYLGLGIGSLLGLIIFGIGSDKILKHMSKGGVPKPEYRLPPLIPGAILIPAGLFWYGWSAENHAPWIVPVLGSAVVGLGLLATFMATQTYVVDAFPLYAASATAAMTILRSLFGAMLPLAGQSMYASLGLGWGNSLLAFIAIGLLPVPFIFMRWGERIRTSERFKIEL